MSSHQLEKKRKYEKPNNTNIYLNRKILFSNDFIELDNDENDENHHYNHHHTDYEYPYYLHNSTNSENMLGSMEKSNFRSFNKNIISINLDQIQNTESYIKLKLINNDLNIFCYKCGSILSNLSSKKIKQSNNKWQCELCNTQNETNLTNWSDILYDNDYELVIDDDDYDYGDMQDDMNNRLDNNNNNRNTTNDHDHDDQNGNNDDETAGLIIFCIDCSGSMAGERINSVKNACLKTIDLITNLKPNYRVAILTFDSLSKYYGHGDLKHGEPTITKQEWLNKNEAKFNQIRKHYASRLRPVSECYELLKETIQNLDADGGTNICGALAHSILLAASSSIHNTNSSFIILCTDGCAADSDEHFYETIVDYSKQNGFIKINIISFEDTDCNLSLLGKLACETNGHIRQTCSNGSDLDQLFLFILEDCLNQTIKSSSSSTAAAASACGQTNSNGLDIKILSNYEQIDLNQTGKHELLFTCLNKSTRELLIEFSLIKNNKLINSNNNYYLFQFQIKTSKSTIRVLTEKFYVSHYRTAYSRNEELIHVYTLRCLSSLVLDRKDMIIAKDYLRKYENFLFNSSESRYTSNLTEHIIKLIKNLPFKINFTNLNDADSQLLYNTKNLTSDEFRKQMQFKQVVSSCTMPPPLTSSSSSSSAVAVPSLASSTGRVDNLVNDEFAEDADRLNIFENRIRENEAIRNNRILNTISSSSSSSLSAFKRTSTPTRTKLSTIRNTREPVNNSNYYFNPLISFQPSVIINTNNIIDLDLNTAYTSIEQHRNNDAYTTNNNNISSNDYSLLLENNKRRNTCSTITNHQQNVLNKHSFKMIMISLKMIKEATNICINANKYLSMNNNNNNCNINTNRSNTSMPSSGAAPDHLNSGTSNKSDKFLRVIFDNINVIEQMLFNLTNGTSILNNKDNYFLNKFFNDLKNYLDLDLYESIQYSNFNY